MAMQDSDDAMRAAGDVYGFMLRQVMMEAIEDGFWFESGSSNQVSWFDINWRDSEGASHHRKILDD